MKTRLYKSFFHVVILTCYLVVIFLSQPATPALATANSAPLMTLNAWNALGSGISNNQVRAIAVNGTDIYAAGSFTDIGDSNGDRIAKWNGSSWSALGSGISNGQVNSLVFNGSILYVGGSFTSAGGVSGADNIAQWDGSSWSTLGNGLTSAVNTIAVNGTNIYAAGAFLNAGSDPNADYIAKLDGGTWESVGTSPLNGTIQTIVVAGPTVYAGGDFTGRISMWDGSSWTTLGGGLNNTVYALALVDTDLYVGGLFSDVAGNGNADRIVKWDGSSWSALASGVGPGGSSVFSIVASGSNLYVGGDFTEVGGDTNIARTARWDGSSWSALGATPLNNAVRTVLINGLDFYAGGNFTDAGDSNGDRIALFQIDGTAPTVNSFTATSPSSSLNIPITAFTASDNLAVTGYKITESSTAPSAGAAGWTGSAPTTYIVASSGAYTLYPWAKDASGNVSAVYGSPANVTVDTSAPTVTGFSAPASSSSLTISGITFTASDNVGVTGYKITESSTPPSAGAAGWTGSAPASFTVASSGSHTLYPWAKDAVGNVSAVYGSPATVSVDTTSPTVTTFTATSPSTSLNIPITDFTASDDVGVTGYLITESSTPPSAGAAGWTGSAPSTYAVVSNGAYVLYPWAKDAFGHVSAAYGSPATVTVDVDAPTVDTFSAPSTSNSLDIPITDFTASDNVAVTGYLITESSGQPSAGAAGWTGSAPSTYTVTSSGTYTLYPWAKDAAGNVSAVYGSPATVTACVPGPITVTSSNDSGAGTLRQAIDAACAGATINFDSSLSGETIHINSTLTLWKNVTIDGSSLASQISISGDSDNDGTGDLGVFYVHNAVTAATLDSLTITRGMNLSILGPTAGYGGAIENNGTLTITNSTLSANFATDGGAIFNNGANDNQGALTISNSTFFMNGADSDGGGILNYAGVVTITNSTFFGNGVMGNGGAISQVVEGTMTVINSTLSGNYAGSGGGLYIPNASGNFLHYANTIIANSGGGDCVANASRIITNVNNLVEDGGCLATLSGDPNLDALADNGGPTQTFALLSGSTAINAGDDTTCAASPISNLDQRGVTRPNGAQCDIGAYELDVTAPIVTAFSASSSNSLNIPVTAFTASDATGVTGYLITENNTPPSASNPGWTSSSPTSYTLTSMGNYTLYPWAKDAAGNVSAVYGSPATVVACIPGSHTVTSSADSGAGTLRRAITDACAGATIDFDSSLSGASIYLNSSLQLSRDVTIDGSALASQITLSGDSDNDGGGNVRVLFIQDNINITLDSLTITKGSTGSWGAGITNGGVLTIKNSTISNNTADSGAGITSGGTLTITDSTISNNAANSSGGGITSDGTLTIINSTVSGNSAVDGAGIYHSGGVMTVVNSTVSGNSAMSVGGGFLLGSDDDDATLINVTISGNSASFGGGILQYPDTQALNYSNTIIANSSGGDCKASVSILIGTNTNNLVEDGTCSPTLSNDPNLGALASNGGPTQTLALLSGSPAIDAGDDAICAATPVSGLDQRGMARPADAHCDIGAYEGDFSSPSVVSITRASTNPTNAASVDFTVTFSETVTGVDTGDFSLVMSGVSGATPASVSGSGATRTVSVNTGSGSGTLRLDLLSSGIQDNAGNALSGIFTSGESYTIDRTGPSVVSSIRASTNPSKAASVNFTVTFSESVTGVDAADFSLTTTGVSGAAISGVSGSGTTRTVSVGTGSGNGTIRLDVPVSATVTDTASNALSGLPYTSGQSYTINKTVTLTLMSSAAQDGWILESSENSNKGSTLNSTTTTFRLGDDATKKQYRGILSFNTAGIPDTAVITGVTLKVKRQGVTGSGNPLSIFKGFMVDIKKGYFSTAANLQTADFQATTSKTYGPFRPVLASNWYSINLTTGKTYINKLSTNSGLTQIRLRFNLDDNNNAIANYLSLYSGNAPAASRPQLEIKYYVP